MARTKTQRRMLCGQAACDLVQSGKASITLVYHHCARLLATMTSHHCFKPILRAICINNSLAFTKPFKGGVAILPLEGARDMLPSRKSCLAKLFRYPYSGFATKPRSKEGGHTTRFPFVFRLARPNIGFCLSGFQADSGAWLCTSSPLTTPSARPRWRARRRKTPPRRPLRAPGAWRCSWRGRCRRRGGHGTPHQRNNKPELMKV